MEVKKKKCVRCKCTLRLAKFGRDKRMGGGLKSACKGCLAAAGRQSYTPVGQ